jgi:hypothetical protein
LFFRISARNEPEYPLGPVETRNGFAIDLCRITTNAREQKFEQGRVILTVPMIGMHRAPVGFVLLFLFCISRPPLFAAIAMAHMMRPCIDLAKKWFLATHEHAPFTVLSFQVHYRLIGKLEAALSVKWKSDRQPKMICLGLPAACIDVPFVKPNPTAGF